MSNIEWTEETWNPVVGCSKVSEGCRNCYAMPMAKRLASMAAADLARGLNPGRKDAYARVVKYKDGVPLPQWNGHVECVADALTIPLGWKKPRTVFVNSMGDLFHEDVPFDFIDRVFAVMALCPQHTFQVLTKRPERMAEYLACGGARRGIHVYNAAAEIIICDWSKMPGDMASTRSSGGSWWPLPNVWLGTSCEDQAAADQRIPHLLRCPAAVRFLSCEPLLNGIELGFPQGCRGCNHPGNIMPVWNSNGRCSRCDGTRQERETEIHWVIVGGESGGGARPCDIDWIRDIVGQCRGAGVACFVKQLGAMAVMPRRTCAIECGCGLHYGFRDPKGGDPAEWPGDLRVREMPGTQRTDGTHGERVRADR